MSATTNATAADLLAPSHDMIRMVATNGSRLVLAEIPASASGDNWNYGRAAQIVAKAFEAVALAVCSEPTPHALVVGPSS